MKFCPKCGSLMVVVRKNGKAFYKCPRCGYEMPVNKGESLKLTEKVREEEKVVSTKVISEPANTGKSKEEIQQELEEYYEQVLDQLANEY